MGAAVVGGGYAAWLLIPVILSSELDGHVKGMVVTALGAPRTVLCPLWVIGGHVWLPEKASALKADILRGG